MERITKKQIYLIVGFFCACLILLAFGPLFGLDTYILVLSLCVILTSIAFVLYIPARMEFDKQYRAERLNSLPPEKLEKFKKKNPKLLNELEEMLKEKEQNEKNRPIEPR